MNKGELVSAIASELEGQTKKSINEVIDAFVKVVTEAVADGDKVTLVGFGTFESTETKEREGRNPKTNEKIMIPASTKPKFSPGKDFKEKVLAGNKSE